MIVYFEKIDENVSLPFYANETDAGMDIISNEDVLIAPGETKVIKTGLKMAIPEGYEIQVRPRSGCSSKTLIRISNAPGTIDAGYRDEIGIIVQNTSKDYYWDDNDNIRRLKMDENNIYTIDDKGNKNGWYKVRKGDRIAQIVLNKIEKAELTPTNDVTKIGINRGGGFGHSGTRKESTV